MKKIFKGLLIFILILVVLAAGYFVYVKFIAKVGDRDAFSLIPEDAVFVVETTNLSKAWTTISESELWGYLTSTQYFADVNEDIEMVNMFLQSNAIADAMLNDRKLIMSAHMTSGVDWDFLFTVDLEDASETFKNVSSALGMIDGYNLVKKEYKNSEDLFPTEIFELTNQNNANDKIFICLVDNILLVSFTGTIIEKALEGKDDNHWANNAKFQEITAEMGSRKLFKFYFNFALLDEFSKTFLTEEDEIISMLSNSMNYSIFDLDLLNNKLTFEGFAKLDTVSSYIKALNNVEPGKIRAYEIMTDQTAIYFSIAFDKYTNFYESLINEFKEGSPADYEDMTKGIELAEKLLKISVQDDFFSWIGSEIAIFKIRPMVESEREQDIVIAIQANDIELAKTGLTHITDQIRKRTSIKFESYEYKNYEINYLAEKGLIKLLFGKLFDRIEKPYFTFIEDYVIMSNSQEVLVNVIDDYIAGRTLSHKQSFVDFKDEFDVKTNISLFIQMPKIYTLLYHYTPKENLSGLHENKEMILSFARIGFQLTNFKDNFKTTLKAEYDKDAIVDDELEKIDAETQSELSTENYENLDFKINLSKDTLKNNGSYKQLFQDGKTICFEGTISDNTLNGLWRSYYESGNLKSSVNYKDGMVDGIAYFYYDDDVNTLLAEIKFSEDKIIDFYQEYYENGAQKAKIQYSDNVADGIAEFYYKTGRKKIEGEYKKGEKDGKWKFYDENEDLISTEKWKNGEKKK